MAYFKTTLSVYYIIVENVNDMTTYDDMTTICPSSQLPLMGVFNSHTVDLSNIK